MRVRVLLAVAAALCACGGGSSGGGGGGGSGGTSDGGTGGGGGSDGGGGSGGGGSDGGGTLAQGGGDWAQYRGGVRGTSENPGAFDAAEAANLRVAWRQDLSANGTSQFYTQAMIAGDTAYFTTAIAARVLAVDAGSGNVRWSRGFTPDVTTACGGVEKRGFWAAPAVVGDVLYLAAADGHAYALRRQDGSTIWASAIADPTPAGHGEFLQSSPAVSTALGKLYLGIASSEHCDEVRGKIAMIDLATGAAKGGRGAASGAASRSTRTRASSSPAPRTGSATSPPSRSRSRSSPSAPIPSTSSTTGRTRPPWRTAISAPRPRCSRRRTALPWSPPRTRTASSTYCAAIGSRLDRCGLLAWR